MFELAGLAYDLVKDFIRYIEWKEEEKLVDFDWPNYSGFSAKAAEFGKSVFWSRADKIELRIHEGCELALEIDKKKRVRRRIVLKDGLVLMTKDKGD